MTERQWQMIHLVARGFTDKEMQQELGLAQATISNTLHDAKRKLRIKGLDARKFVLLCQRLSGCLQS